MYPKDNHFEKTQALYLAMRKDGIECEICLKPGYGYYIKQFHKSDNIDCFPLVVDEVIFQHIGPNSQRTYEFPLED